jgi:hypothetical protein
LLAKRTIGGSLAGSDGGVDGGIGVDRGGAGGGGGGGGVDPVSLSGSVWVGGAVDFFVVPSLFAVDLIAICVAVITAFANGGIRSKHKTEELSLVVFTSEGEG